MAVFVSGLLLFFVPHLVPILLPGARKSAITAIGEGPWKGTYSLLSLAGLVLVTVGWMQYRGEAPEIYTPPDWGRHATSLFVWFAFILFSVPRTKPGRILVMVKHPMLFGTFYWAVGHLLVNGDLASILLFGSFLAFVALSRVSEGLKGDPPHQFISHRSDAIAIGVGTILYIIFAFWVHGWLFGISPF